MAANTRDRNAPGITFSILCALGLVSLVFFVASIPQQKRKERSLHGDAKPKGADHYDDRNYPEYPDFVGVFSEGPMVEAEDKTGDTGQQNRIPQGGDEYLYDDHTTPYVFPWDDPKRYPNRFPKPNGHPGLGQAGYANQAEVQEVEVPSGNSIEGSFLPSANTSNEHDEKVNTVEVTTEQIRPPPLNVRSRRSLFSSRLGKRSGPSSSDQVDRDTTSRSTEHTTLLQPPPSEEHNRTLHEGPGDGVRNGTLPSSERTSKGVSMYRINSTIGHQTTTSGKTHIITKPEASNRTQKSSSNSTHTLRGTRGAPEPGNIESSGTATRSLFSRYFNMLLYFFGSPHSSDIIVKRDSLESHTIDEPSEARPNSKEGKSLVKRDAVETNTVEEPAVDPHYVEIKSGITKFPGPDVTKTKLFHKRSIYAGAFDNSKFLRQETSKSIKWAVENFIKASSNTGLFEYKSMIRGNKVWHQVNVGTRHYTYTKLGGGAWKGWCTYVMGSYMDFDCYQQDDTAFTRANLESALKGELVLKELFSNGNDWFAKGSNIKFLLLWGKFLGDLEVHYHGQNVTLEDFYDHATSKKKRSVVCTSSGTSFIWVHPTITCPDPSDAITDMAKKWKSQRDKDMEWVKDKIQENQEASRVMLGATVNSLKEVTKTVIYLNSILTGITRAVSMTTENVLINTWQDYTLRYIVEMNEVEGLLTFVAMHDAQWDLSLLAPHMRDEVLSLPDGQVPIGQRYINVEFAPNDTNTVIIDCVTLMGEAGGELVEFTPLTPLHNGAGWVICPPIKQYLSQGQLWDFENTPTVPAIPHFKAVSKTLPDKVEYIRHKYDISFCMPYHGKTYEIVFKSKCYSFDLENNKTQDCSYAVMSDTETITQGSLSIDLYLDMGTIPTLSRKPFEHLSKSINDLERNYTEYSRKMNQTLTLPVFDDWHYGFATVSLGTSLGLSIWIWMVYPLAFAYFYYKIYKKRMQEMDMRIEFMDSVIRQACERFADEGGKKPLGHLIANQLKSEVTMEPSIVKKIVVVNGMSMEGSVASCYMHQNKLLPAVLVFKLNGNWHKRVLTDNQYHYILRTDKPAISLDEKDGVTV